MYRLLLKPILFLFDPEKTHHFVINATKLVFKIPGIPWIFRKIFQVNHKNLERNLFGLNFDNPVGLAAGFDKDAKFVAELASMGFGFIEIGTITPKAQPGNARPRLFRLPVDCALINRMGFNNAGVDAAVKRLKNGKFKVIIGGNIGKNKVTPNESAASDYLACFNALFPVVDYFVVNVSSPNTPDLRQLQEKEPLMALLQEIQLENNKKLSPKPVLLKIAPDLNNEQLDDIVDIVKQEKLSGIIATNTTISRDNLNTSKGIVERMGMGGLSGLPLKDRSTEVITYLHNRSKGQIPIIAVGGIFSGADAWQKLQAGASLVQVYTGFIYQGPHIVKEINNYILKQLQD